MQEPQHPAIETSPPTPRPAKKKRWTALLATIALLLSLLGLVSQFLFWQFYTNNHRQMLEQTQQLNQSLHDKLQTVTSDLTNQQKQIETLIARTDDRRNTLLLAEEAQHLLTLAQYNLLFQNNTEFSSKLLQEADHKLAEINDPNVNPTRKAIMSDLTALNAVPKVDITAIISRLSGISDQVSKLSTIPIIPLETEVKQSQPHKTWKEKIIDVFHSLRGVLTIRRLPESITPLPSPEHQLYLVENIRLKMTQAEWAVLHQNPTLYQLSLEEAKKQLQKYYSRNPQGANLIQMITDLQQINIKPEVPNLANSIALLQTYIRDTHQSVSESIKQNAVVPAQGTTQRALPS